MVTTISFLLLSVLLTAITLLKLKNKYFLSFIVLIVFAYTAVGPLISFFDLESANQKIYFIYQPIILALFYIPFLLFLLFFNKPYEIKSNETFYRRLPILLPIIIFCFLVVFIYVVVENNLLFRRIGHEALAQATSQLNVYQKIIYRLITESSFFVVLSFRAILLSSNSKTKNIYLYKVVFLLFASIFLLYFLLNSRMQFVLFLVFLLFPLKLSSNQNFSKFIGYGFLILLVLLFLTLFREISLEASGRVIESSFLSQIQSAISIIGKRLNILEIFYTIHHYGYDPLSLNMSGFYQVIYFPISAFIDPQYYEITKLNLTTSSSVVVANEITGGGFVDFPKTIIIEVMLSFGALSLFALALIYSKLTASLTAAFYKSPYLSIKWYLAAYLITIFFQFEKEFFSMFFSTIKWSIILIIFILTGPSKKYYNSKKRKL